MLPLPYAYSFYFFHDTPTTEIYTLSLHDALPIYLRHFAGDLFRDRPGIAKRLDHLEKFRRETFIARDSARLDRKSTRLNSSHSQISYAVFCLKKKKKRKNMVITIICDAHDRCQCS